MTAAETFAQHVAQFEALQTARDQLAARVAELEAIEKARNVRIDELEAERVRLAIERDDAFARRTEIETQMRSFGALVCDALRQLPPRQRPELQIPAASPDEPTEQPADSKATVEAYAASLSVAKAA